MSNYSNPLFDFTNRKANPNRFAQQSSMFDPMANMPGFGVLQNPASSNTGSTTSGLGSGVGAASGAGAVTSRPNITPNAGGGQPASPTNTQNPNGYAASTSGSGPTPRQVTIVDVQSANTIAGLINLSNSVDTMADSATKSHLQDIIKDKIYEMRRAEKFDADRNFKETQRKDWAEKRTRQEMQRDYPQWVDWMKMHNDNPQTDLSYQAYEEAMQDSGLAAKFRGHLRLKSFKSNIQDQQGLGAGRNAADVANTRESAKDVDTLLRNIGSPEAGLAGSTANDAISEALKGDPNAVVGGDQDQINAGIRSSGNRSYDPSTTLGKDDQADALAQLRKQRDANLAAKKDPQYQADQTAYRNLQVRMMNLGLSADVQMRMNSDIEKGLISPQDAMRMVLMMEAGAKSRGQTLPQALPTGAALRSSRQANDLRIGRNTTDTQPQRQTVPVGFPEQMAAESRSRAQTNELGYQANQGTYLDALARGEITPEQYRMLTGG